MNSFSCTFILRPAKLVRVARNSQKFLHLKRDKYTFVEERESADSACESASNANRFIIFIDLIFGFKSLSPLFSVSFSDESFFFYSIEIEAF